MIRAAGHDDGRPWFAVRDYPVRVRDVDVDLMHDGALIIGHLGVDRGSGKLAWLTRHVSGVAMILTPWRHPMIDPPRRYPSAWRPGSDVRFPHVLPQPLASPVAPMVAADEASPAPPSEGDGWPYPDVRLGLGAPTSIEETEARVLRALRTVDAGPRVGHVRRQTSGDFSPEWFAILRRYEDHDAEDKSHIGPVRALFEPTRRDLTDADQALGWLFAVAGADMIRVFRMRAADPAWSFAQIVEGRQSKWRRRAALHAAYRATVARLLAYAATTVVTTPAKDTAA